VSFYLFPFCRPRSPSQTTESLLYYRVLYLIIPEVHRNNGACQTSMRSGAMLTNWRFVCNAYAATEAGHRLIFLPMPGVNRQGQAHIVSTAIVSPGSGKGGREVEATPWFRTWFSIDPQPASISPTINISIVFICAFLIDCGRTIRHRRSKTILARSCERGAEFLLPLATKRQRRIAYLA
jgi:hypothetical protein